MIKRYVKEWDSLHESKDGDWVEYDDHAKIVVEQALLIVDLENELADAIEHIENSGVDWDELRSLKEAKT